jgi:SAM-dependent methyltransferase
MQRTIIAPLSFYPADLARIHDEGFGDFARAAACELLRRLPDTGRVVELGCGTGISSAILSDAGYDVLGIDISPDMLAVARGRAPGGDFRVGSLWQTSLPACVAVTAIGEVINYGADERAGEESLPELFGRVHSALRPLGLFLFDFATPGRGGRGVQAREGDGWRIESEATEDSGTLERRMRIVEGDRDREEIHRLHLYRPELVCDHLDRAGFTAERLASYCDFGFWPGYAAFAAVKDG